MERYREVALTAPDYHPMDYYSSGGEDQDLSEWLAQTANAGSRGVDVDLAAAD
jgi:hypothetical protein